MSQEEEQLPFVEGDIVFLDPKKASIFQKPPNWVQVDAFYTVAKCWKQWSLTHAKDVIYVNFKEHSGDVWAQRFSKVEKIHVTAGTTEQKNYLMRAFLPVLSILNENNKDLFIWSMKGEKVDIREYSQEGIHVFVYARPSHVEGARVRTRTYATFVVSFYNTTQINGFTFDSRADITNDYFYGYVTEDKKAAFLFIPADIFALDGVDQVSLYNYMRANLYYAFEALMIKMTTFEDRIKAFLKDISQRERRNLESEQVKLFSDLRQAENNLVNLYNRYLAVQKKLESQADAIPPSLIKQITKLQEHPKVKEIVPMSGSLLVRTKPIHSPVLSDGTTRLLGEYEINLFSSRSPDILNKTHLIGGRLHPHCDVKGKMCWGDFHESLLDLSARGEFAALAVCIIDFLCTVQEQETYGRSVFNFPIYKGEVNA